MWVFLTDLFGIYETFQLLTISQLCFFGFGSRGGDGGGTDGCGRILLGKLDGYFGLEHVFLVNALPHILGGHGSLNIDLWRATSGANEQLLC